MITDSAIALKTTEFGRLVRQHRVRMGLTQRELADLSTVSERAIRDLEQGRARRPRHDTVTLIAEGLRLGPSARTALMTAAGHGGTYRSLKAEYDVAQPAPTSGAHPIIGREVEIAELEDELTSGPERLVNVVGLGGVGKTRLVLEAANRVQESARFPVLWFTFPDSSPEHGISRCDDALGGLINRCVYELFNLAKQDGAEARSTARPSNAWPNTAQIAELVGKRPALLVVDCTGVHAPRPESLAWLMQACPELRLLTTSERPYVVPRERLFLLAPLEPPSDQQPADLETFLRVPSIRFFLDRVRRSRAQHMLSGTDAAVIIDICRLLDGIPLALQAATSWLDVYDWTTLRDCLRSDPESLLNHASGVEGTSRLRQALDRSLLHLPADSALLIAALCEWNGDFGLEDAVTLTGRSLPDCGRMIHELLVRGTIRPAQAGSNSRFRVLNLVRALHSITPRCKI
ncbi:helix-turn-helix domain-containing protein [Streptomyces sp. NPDC021218]|uniref:helix-turn-helix domain-containing protein n=1 Tax=Streptomyces sp. NPDC021218 TaxID=3365119 RepID=UPI0037A70F08